MKNILVTGGAGFIGSNFVLHMLEKYPDYRIVNVDLLTYAANLNNLKNTKNKLNYKFVKGDISNVNFVFNLFENEKFDMVVNFAAESHVDKSIISPGIFIQTNVVGTQVLLDACKKYGIKRYHQISTDEVYGDLPLDRIDLLFTEKTDLNPSSPYSASKAAADMLVKAYNKTYEIPITISRCSNNYGAFQYPEKLIPLAIIHAIKNYDIPIYGSGANVRDWLHVKDHCTAIDLILHKGEIGEVYNIGGNNEKTNLDIVKIILNKLGKSKDLIKYVADRPGHDLRYAIDATKIKNDLGWIPTYDFESGIENTIDWYLKNKHWWNQIF